ncbi:MAG: endonuclease III [Spirochaetales bacterium]|nr:endonuclease III [Spirochaetales bacterium]
MSFIPAFSCQNTGLAAIKPKHYTAMVDGSVETYIQLLAGYYPEEFSFINYSSPWELLVAVILSAQTTDRQVNAITPELFSRWPGPAELMQADPARVEEVIRPTGFFRVKAAHIIQSSALLVSEYGGRVPEGFEDLLRFPGIGRKSANVIRGHVYDLPAIIVDTHFGRVVRRLGIAVTKDPEQIESVLRAIVPSDEQMGFSMRVNKLGREFCHARKPECTHCPLEKACPKTGVSNISR